MGVLDISPATALRGWKKRGWGLWRREKNAWGYGYIFFLVKPREFSEKVPDRPDFCSAVCSQLLLSQSKTSSLAQGKTQSRLLFVVFKLECLFWPMCSLPAGTKTSMKNYFKDTFLKPTVHKSPERACDYSGNSSAHYVLNPASWGRGTIIYFLKDFEVFKYTPWLVESPKRNLICISLMLQDLMTKKCFYQDFCFDSSSFPMLFIRDSQSEYTITQRRFKRTEVKPQNKLK